MKNRIFVFPGQGSQGVGMAADFAHHPASLHLAQQVDDALNTHLFKLMREGPAETLTQTENTQPALLLAGLMALTYLQSQSGKPIEAMAQAVAGHSVGEYTAVTAARGMQASEAAQLVRLRGQAMAQVHGGGMSAVLGLSVQAAEQVAATTGITLANDNAEGQIILSGPLDMLERAEQAAKVAGAKRCLRLNVSGPFHTAAMQPAAQAVQQFLSENPLQPLAVPCILNHSAQPESAPDAVTQGLIAQITNRVRWRESMQHLATQATEDEPIQVVELGSGKVLSGLATRCSPKLQATSLQTRADVDAWLETNL